MNTKNEIVDLIKKIKKINKLDESLYNSNLCGLHFNLGYVDLLYLFFELEKKFNIKFTLEDINNYKFTSINNIEQIINKKISRNC